MIARTKKETVARKARVAKNTPKKRAPLWELHLYVANHTPRSVLASENLESFCQQYLAGRYRVTIVDIVKQPALAREHEILATPTLIRVLPGPREPLLAACLTRGVCCRRWNSGTNRRRSFLYFPTPVHQWAMPDRSGRRMSEP